MGFILFVMRIKQTLGTIVLAGALALGGCEKEEPKPEYRNIKGNVCQLDQRELIYGDNRGFGSGKNIPVPITFLGIEAEGKKYQIILAGPHNLKQGDSVDLDYLVDNEVTGREIWRKFYSQRADFKLMTIPDARFRADGYASAWKKQ